MTYDDEVKKAAFFYCGLLPSDIEFMKPDDLVLLIKTGQEKSKIEDYKSDTRAARITSDILNVMAQLVRGIEGSPYNPSMFLPENRGKPKEEGMDPNAFRAWVDAHNKTVEENASSSNGA